MTDDRMALLDLIEKQADGDLVREMLAFAADRVMEAEVVEKNGCPSPTALRTNLPPCPWPRNPTKCPRNRVWFIMTSGHPGSYTSFTDVTGASRIRMTMRRPDWRRYI